MALVDRIKETIEPMLESMGYELVRVHIMGSKKSPTLQIMAERADGNGMGVDDCAAISNSLSEVFEKEDPIASAYELEVSSPGIDRPLTRLKDFSRFAGFEAKMQTREPLDGQRNFHGTLCGVEGDAVVLDAGKTKIILPFGAIDQARLVMNDALMQAAMNKQINA